jgi:hypothetical protein
VLRKEKDVLRREILMISLKAISDKPSAGNVRKVTFMLLNIIWKIIFF